MSEVKKVTPEELQQVKDLQNEYLKATFDLGQIAIDKKDALEKLDKSDKAENEAFRHLASLKHKEQELSNILQEKYGSSTIDLETGVIQ